VLNFTILGGLNEAATTVAYVLADTFGGMFALMSYHTPKLIYFIRIVLVFSDKDFVTAVLDSNGVLATDAVSRKLQSDQQTFADVCSYLTVDGAIVSAVCAESMMDSTNSVRVPPEEAIIPVSFLTLNAPVS
jgi:hypothetical protein